MEGWGGSDLGSGFVLNRWHLIGWGFCGLGGRGAGFDLGQGLSWADLRSGWTRELGGRAWIAGGGKGLIGNVI